MRMDDHVFVCYSRKDEDFALKLATNLKNQGVPIWLDQWDILPSDDWDRSIDKALYGCKYFLIILSSTSVDSKEVRGELRTALDKNKTIVPILYQSCEIPRQLRLIQYIDFVSRNSDDRKAIEQALRALGKAKGAPAAPVAQREPKQEKASDWYNKGDALYGQGKLDEAIVAYNRAIEINPKDANAWLKKGEVLAGWGKFDESMQPLNKAIEIDPKNVRAWSNKGYSLRHLGKYDEAIQAYNKVIEINPNNANAWIGKGEALKSLGKTKEANAAFRTAKELGAFF
jgi:tetratricopeptide (TPR) repeat protein